MVDFLDGRRRYSAEFASGGWAAARVSHCQPLSANIRSLPRQGFVVTLPLSLARPDAGMDNRHHVKSRRKQKINSSSGIDHDKYFQREKWLRQR